MSYSSQWNGGSGWGNRSSRRQDEQRPRSVTPGPARAPAAFLQGLADHAAVAAGGGRPRLDGSVSQFRRTLEAAANGDPHRRRYANSLGVALLDRYHLTGQVDDLDQALGHFLYAYERADRGTLSHARALRNLFTSLQLRLSLTDPPLPAGLRERLPTLKALRREKSRTPGLSAIERLSAARESGHAAVAEKGPAAGCPDLAYAVELLPLAVWGGRDQVLDFLAEYRGLASEAAASALAADDPALAVRLLEQGRAVVWERDLTTRTPREELLKRLTERKAAENASARKPSDAKAPAKSHKPQKQPPSDETHPPLPADLGARMDRVFANLTRLDPTGPFARGVVEGAKGDPRMDTDRWGFPWRPESVEAGWTLGRLAGEWESLSRTAQRGLPYISFVQPDFRRDIRPAADEGPVVYVNVGPWRCDALLVTRDAEQPQVIRLPDLTASEAERQAQTYLTAMTATDGEGREHTIREVLDWLWRTIAAPVLDALPGLPGPPPQLWWIPTGPLTTLPLHAAAHGESPDGRSALDLVISSYTPNVSALLRARRARDRRSRPQDGRRHLLVTPVTEHLPGAARTRTLLTRLLPQKQRTTLDGPDATWEHVREALPRHTWTHFDCHAVQDLDQPLRSHLALHDRPLTVADLAALPTTGAEFALLAACTTAAGGRSVRDEWVSLAAALMHSEFQAVIGTLWPVPDGPTARIVQDIYAALFPHPDERDGASPDPRPSPLHRALRLLRRLLPGSGSGSGSGTGSGTGSGSGSESGKPPAQRPERPAAPPVLRHGGSAQALRLALLGERARRPDHPSAWVSFVHYGA